MPFYTSTPLYFRDVVEVVFGAENVIGPPTFLLHLHLQSHKGLGIATVGGVVKTPPYTAPVRHKSQIVSC